MAKKIGLEIEIKSDSVGVAAQKTEDINQELERLKKSLAGGQLSGEAFSQAAKRAGELEDKIAKVNTVIKNLSNDNAKLDAVVNTAQGLAGGFAAAQGAAALFGTENEDLQQTFVKLQAAMSILNGVQAISNVLRKESALNTILLSKANVLATTSTNGLTTATKGFSKALIATGIGAVVLAIGLLIANFDKLKGAMGMVTQEQKDQIAAAQEKLALAERELNAISNQENILKLQGKTQKEIIQLKQQSIKAVIALRENELKAEVTSIQNAIKQEKRYKDMLTNVLNFLTAPLQLLMDYANSAAKLLGFEGFDFDIGAEIAKKIFNEESVEEEGKKTIEELKIQLEGLKNEEAGYQLAINDIKKKGGEENNKVDETNAQRKIQLLTDVNERELAELAAKHAKELEMAKKNGEDITLLLELQGRQRAEIILKQREKEQEDLQTSVDNEIAETRRLEEEKEKIRKDAWEANAKLVDKAKKKKEDAAAAEMQLKRDLEQDTIRGLVAISNLFEQGSKGQKAFALASIAADTAVAIGGALRNSQAPTGDNILTGGLAGVAKFAAIAVSILSGAAQAKSVLQGGSVSSFGSGQVQTSVNIPNPPQMQDPRGIRVQQNSRVFVLESDISRTQRRVNVIEQNAIVD